MAYFILKNLILGPLLRVLFRPWVRGMENIPTSGAAILASNHLSFSDSIFLPLQSRRPVVFLAKSEYFTGKGLKGALTRWFFKATGQLPIDRSGGLCRSAGATGPAFHPRPRPRGDRRACCSESRANGAALA